MKAPTFAAAATVLLLASAVAVAGAPSGMPQQRAGVHMRLVRKTTLEAPPPAVAQTADRRPGHRHPTLRRGQRLGQSAAASDGQPGPRHHSLDHAQGSYYTTVSLAGHDYPVDVDTGSSLFAVPSVDCVACATDAACKAHTGPACPGKNKYSAAGSSTAVPLACPPPADSGIQCPVSSTLTCGGITAPTCGCAAPALNDDDDASAAQPGFLRGAGDIAQAPFIQQCYADGSGWRGQLMEDSLDAGYGLDAQVYFVAKVLNIEDAESAEYFTGIIGMAYGPALSGVPTPFERLVEQTGLADMFTMCLCSDSGSLTLGGGITTGGVEYVPITQESYYVVEMKDFLVNGTSIGVSSSIYNAGECIVDSGTTDLALPHSAYLGFYKALAATCSSSELVGICGESEKDGLFGGYEYQMSASDIAAFPTVTVVLGTVELEIPPMQYLTTSGGYTSLAVSDMGDDVSGTILGDTLMRGYIVEFDRENKQVGFAPQAGCCSQ